MSSLSSLNRNVLRLSGLNSGLDTESIIKTMLTTSKNRVDRQYRTQVKMEWKQQAYKDINNELRKIKDEFSTTLKQEQNLLSEMNFRKYTTEYGNTTDSAYFTVSAKPTTTVSSATIQYVKQLATADSVSSNAKVTADGKGLKMTDTMKQVHEKLSQGAGGTPFEYYIENVNGVTTKNAVFTDSSGAQFMQFNFNGKNYKISANATLETMLSTVNADNSDMRLSYSQLTDKFTVQSKTTGKDSNLKLTGGHFLDAIGIHVVDLHSVSGSIKMGNYTGTIASTGSALITNNDPTNPNAPVFGTLAAGLDYQTSSLIDLAQTGSGVTGINHNPSYNTISFNVNGIDYEMDAYDDKGNAHKLEDLIQYVNASPYGTTRLGFEASNTYTGFTLSLTVNTTMEEALNAYKNSKSASGISFDSNNNEYSFKFDANGDGTIGSGETYTFSGTNSAGNPATIADMLNHVNVTMNPISTANPTGVNARRLDFSTADGFTSNLTLNSTLEDVYNFFEGGATPTGAFELDSAGTKLTFNFNGEDYEIGTGETLQHLLNKVNNDNDKVRLGFSTNNTFTITSIDGPGPDANGMIDTNQYKSVQFEASDFTNALGFAASSAITQGQDAVLMIDGVETEQSSNSFELDGVNYTLKKTFNETGDTTDPALGKSFSFTRDLDHTVNLIVKYVDAYNTMIRKIDDLLKYKSSSSLGYNPKDYYPLNDEEKAEMSEDQIKQWEERGKTGIMRSDTQLTGLLNSLRMGFYNKVPGSNMMLSDIGLGGSTYDATTGNFNYNYADAINGIIQVDEQKLRAALTSNPEQVFAMFAARSETDTLGEMGLVNRVNATITDYIQNNELVTQVDNASQISKAKERYQELLEAMYAEEDRLWTKFTALEKTMSTLNSQSEWIGNNMM